jgi:hypothetical protein
MPSWSGRNRRFSRQLSVEKVMRRLITLVLACLLVSSAVAQTKQIRRERRPPAVPAATFDPAAQQKQPTYEYFSILNGMPMLMELHHDTEVGTNKPVDVVAFVIELQVFNSDGDLEPEGLQIFNYFTAHAVSASTAPNPHNARDCKTWNNLVLSEMKTRNPNSPTWSYVEFTVAQGARTIQTNEDGQVWWSDDVECWGARDRFPPF